MTSTRDALSSHVRAVVDDANVSCTASYTRLTVESVRCADRDLRRIDAELAAMPDGLTLSHIASQQQEQATQELKERLRGALLSPGKEGLYGLSFDDLVAASKVKRRRRPFFVLHSGQ